MVAAAVTIVLMMVAITHHPFITSSISSFIIHYPSSITHHLPTYHRSYANLLSIINYTKHIPIYSCYEFTCRGRKFITDLYLYIIIPCSIPPNCYVQQSIKDRSGLVFVIVVNQCFNVIISGKGSNVRTTC